MQKEIEKHIKNNYGNISSVGFKYTCRAVEILINNSELAMMDIYNLIALENKRKLSGIVKSMYDFKNKAGYKDISSKEFIYRIKYNFEEDKHDTNI